MIKKLVLLLVLLRGLTPAYCQELSGRELDSLQLTLRRSIPDTVRLNILFRLAEFYIGKPGEYNQDLENATAYLKKVERINTRLQSEDIRGIHALTTSMLLKEKRQDKQAQEMAEKAVGFLSESNNKYFLGKAYFNLSDYYPYTDRKQLVDKIRLVELAEQAFAQSKDIEAHANSLKYLADLYEINEQKSKVLETLNLSLKLYKSIHYPNLSGLYVLYNRYYYLRGNYKLAMDYCLMALKEAEKVADSSLSYCQINNYMAITLTHLNDRERQFV